MSELRALTARGDEEEKAPPTGWITSRMSDFFLCALIPINYAVPGLPGSAPIPELAVMALALIAMNRRPDSPPRPAWFPMLLSLMWLVLGASTLLNGVDGSRRMLHMTNYVILALILASGRVHTPSALRGFATGIAVAGVSAFVNRVVPIFGAGYGDRFTGLLNDPNVAGYYFAVFGCLGLAGTRSPKLRGWVFLAMILTVAGTQSRTAIAAVGLAALWFVTRRLLSGRVSIAIFAAAWWLVLTLSEKYQQWGPFNDRDGSDALRERIQAAEQVLVTQNPLYGNGAGTAKVDLRGDTFFFHSSYLGLRAEGGWLLWGIFVAFLALTALALTREVRSERQVWIEMALICGVVMAMSLGEVLLELPVAAALGIAMRQALAPEKVVDPDPDDPPSSRADEPGATVVGGPATRSARHAT